MSGVFKTTISKSACAAMLALLVLSAGNLRAEPVPVKVVVTDVDAKPIAGAKVYLCNLTLQDMSVVAEGETGAEGQYFFPAVEDDQQVLAFKDNYSWGGNFLRDKQDISIRLKAPANIGGIVTDKEGKPIEGAMVRPFVEGEHSFGAIKGFPFLVSRTDAEGKFLIEALPQDSRVALLVEAPDGYAAYMDDINSLHTLPIDDVAIKLNPESKIRGTARHETTGKPAVGVTITARQLTPPRYYQQSTTGEDGSFELDNLNSGNYGVRIDGEGKDWGGVMVSAEQVSVGEAETVEDVALLWTDGVFVEGRVLDEANMQPIRATAYFHQKGHSGQPEASCSTDAEGKLEARVKPGSYNLNVYAYAQGYSLYSKPFSVQKDTQLGDILLSKVPEIAVNIQNQDGKPVKGVVVRQFGKTIGTSDDEGVAKLTPMENFGSLEDVLVFSPDRTLGGFFSLPAKPEKDLVWILKRTGSVTGTIQAEDGTPLEGAEVVTHWIQKSSKRRTGWPLKDIPAVRTDAQGRYTFKGLPADVEFAIEANAKGYGRNDPWNDSRSLIVGGQMVEAEIIKLMKADAELTGRIIGQNGVGIGGIQVSVHGPRNRSAFATTDSKGQFIFKELAPSKVNLTVLTDPLQPIIREVMPEQFKDVVITIYPSRNFKSEKR